MVVHASLSSSGALTTTSCAVRVTISTLILRKIAGKDVRKPAKRAEIDSVLAQRVSADFHAFSPQGGGLTSGSRRATLSLQNAER